MLCKRRNKASFQKCFFQFTLFVVLLSSCITREALQPANFTDFLLLSSIGPFDMISNKPVSPAIRNYFKDYFEIIPDLEMHSGYYISPRKPRLSHDAGYISHDLILTAHMLMGSKTDTGTAILIHGYTGTARYTHFQYFAQQFIKNGYKVVLLNLPGNEFSGGYRGSVESFEDYGDMVIAFLTQYRKHMGEKTHIIGLSTGSVSIFDAMRRKKQLFSSIDKITLISPFIHIKNSGLFNFASYFINSIPSGNSGPLSIYNIPNKWIRKAHEWGKALAKERQQKLENENLFIVFGEKDKIIDIQKSKKFYKKTYPNATIKTYTDQDHLLSKEGYKIFREDVMKFFLSSKF